MPYILHPLGKTFYQSKGSSKRALIILHGGPGSTCRLHKDFLELSKIRKVFIYDQLGCGRSSASTKKDWTIKSFVQELSYLINEWGVEEFDLMGTSWGTTLALEYYLRKKDSRIKSLIFQSPMFSAKDWENDGKLLIRKLSPKTKKVLKYCHEIGATDSKVYSEAMFEFYSKHVLRNKKLLKELFEKKSSGSNSQIYEYMWGPSEFKPTGTLKSYDRVDKLKTIKVPTLIICGEHDEARPITGKKYTKMIPFGEFYEIKGGSHILIVEKKKALLSKIRNFLV